MVYYKSFLPIILALVSIIVIPVNAQHPWLSEVPEMEIIKMRNGFNAANLIVIMKKQAQMTWVDHAWYQSFSGGAKYYVWAYFEILDPTGFFYERRCYMGGTRNRLGVYNVDWIACSYKPISARSRKRSKYELFPKKSKKQHKHKKHHEHHSHSSSSSSS